VTIRLSRWTELSSGAMTNRLDRLEEAGIVRRLPDPDDRRGLQIELTDEGMKIYERAMKTQAEKESTATSALTKRELKELNGLLRRMMLDFERREGTKT
jgi:DNA-binding MarR family transcriptional regulator